MEEIGQYSVADGMSLLRDVYGFQINRVGDKISNQRLSYNWRRISGELVVEGVVSWHTYVDHPNTFDPIRLAGQLGLSPIQLAEATKGRYSRSCLRLIKYIDGLHYYLARPEASNRKSLIILHGELKDEFAQNPIGNTCLELLAYQDRNARIREIKNHPDTQAIGGDLETWTRRL